MSVTDDAAALIRRRLAELGDERLKLARTLAVLGSSGRTDGPRSAGSGRGPTRKQEVLAQVEASPSIRTAEIAAAIGISTNQVSNLLAPQTRGRPEEGRPQQEMGDLRLTLGRPRAPIELGLAQPRSASASSRLSSRASRTSGSKWVRRPSLITAIASSTASAGR